MRTSTVINHKLFILGYYFSLHRPPTSTKVMITVDTGTLLSVLPLFLQELNLEMAKNKSRSLFPSSQQQMAQNSMT